MKIDSIWMKLMELGSRFGCHQRADRSFSIGNYQFPVCARCTGILISTIIAYIVYFTRKIKVDKCVWIIIPMIVDGTLQYFGICESNNKRRFITGLLGGFGCTCIRLNIFMNLIHTIKKF
ncbi:MAG: DUF2085 domain-containing protein [Lachnospiraceae bacterium]|nr:DUF2085 domain-containing protein [Lachnospiraceae bacterium]